MTVKKKKTNLKPFIVVLLLFVALASLVIATLATVAFPAIVYVLFSFGALYCVLRVGARKRYDAPSWVTALTVAAALLVSVSILAYPVVSIFDQDFTGCINAGSVLSSCLTVTEWKLMTLRLAGILLVPIACIMSVLIWGYFSRSGLKK